MTYFYVCSRWELNPEYICLRNSVILLGQLLVKCIVLLNIKLIPLHKSFFFFFFLVCFKVFDVDRDGVLSRVELRDMVVALLEVWKDNRTDDIPVSSDFKHLIVCNFQQENGVENFFKVSE